MVLMNIKTLTAFSTPDLFGKTSQTTTVFTVAVVVVVKFATVCILYTLANSIYNLIMIMKIKSLFVYANS